MRPTHLRTKHKFDLSPRQVEVVELMARGLTNAEIAARLGISLDGAKYHVREILGKFGVDSREAAVAAWRESRRPAVRLRGAPGAAVAALRWPRAMLAGIAAAAVAGAVAVALVLTSRDDGDAPARPDGSPPPLPTITTVVPTAPAATATPGGCDADPRLELVPEGDDVVIQLYLDGTAACRVLGPARLWPGPQPPYQGRPPTAWVNTDRAFKVAVDLPAPAPLVAWRWGNDCSGGGPPFAWSVEVAGSTATVAAGVRPACTAPASPMAVALEAIQTGADGDVVPDDRCRDRAAGWLCEFAARVAIDVGHGGVAALVADGLPTAYACAAGGQAVGFEYTDICAAARPGESVDGYPLALHGSEGGPRAPDRLVAELDGALGDRSYLAAIGCLTADPACSTVVVAFATRAEPQVAYLVFRLVPGRDPAFVAAGLSGDNAAEILAGGVTRTAAGEAAFVALPPPG